MTSKRSASFFLSTYICIFISIRLHSTAHFIVNVGHLKPIWRNIVRHHSIYVVSSIRIAFIGLFVHLFDVFVLLLSFLNSISHVCASANGHTHIPAHVLFKVHDSARSFQQKFNDAVRCRVCNISVARPFVRSLCCDADQLYEIDETKPKAFTTSMMSWSNVSGTLTRTPNGIGKWIF